MRSRFPAMSTEILGKRREAKDAQAQVLGNSFTHTNNELASCKSAIRDEGNQQTSSIPNDSEPLLAFATCTRLC